MADSGSKRGTPPLNKGGTQTLTLFYIRCETILSILQPFWICFKNTLCWDSFITFTQFQNTFAFGANCSDINRPEWSYWKMITQKQFTYNNVFSMHLSIYDFPCIFRAFEHLRFYKYSPSIWIFTIFLVFLVHLNIYEFFMYSPCIWVSTIFGVFSVHLIIYDFLCILSAFEYLWVFMYFPWILLFTSL